ncbi:SET and MYND domain-containing protein 5-like, partial [Elysia marginata]
MRRCAHEHDVRTGLARRGEPSGNCINQHLSVTFFCPAVLTPPPPTNPWHVSWPRQGKGLVAQKSFQKGDVILEEKPLVCAQFSWNELYKYKACEFCLRSLENAEEMVRRLTSDPSIVLPYPECCDVDASKFSACPHCQVLYCSPECQELAWNRYHQTLCLGLARENPDHPFNQLIDQWRSFHYPPETGSIMLIVKIIAMIKQARSKGAVISMFSNFVNSVINEREDIAHKLLGVQFVDQREILRSMLMEHFFEESVQE